MEIVCRCWECVQGKIENRNWIFTGAHQRERESRRHFPRSKWIFDTLRDFSSHPNNSNSPEYEKPKMFVFFGSRILASKFVRALVSLSLSIVPCLAPAHTPIIIVRPLLKHDSQHSEWDYGNKRIALCILQVAESEKHTKKYNFFIDFCALSVWCCVRRVELRVFNLINLCVFDCFPIFSLVGSHTIFAIIIHHHSLSPYSVEQFYFFICSEWNFRLHFH